MVNTMCVRKEGKNEIANAYLREKERQNSLISPRPVPTSTGLFASILPIVNDISRNLQLHAPSPFSLSQFPKSENICHLTVSRLNVSRCFCSDERYTVT